MSDWLLFLLVTFDLLFVGCQESWRAENLPNPQVQTWGCGRGGQASWICDPTNILTPQQADELDYEIERQVVPCPCSACSTPYPLAIALVPRIQLKSREYPNTTEEKRAALENFATVLRDNSWDFGDCSDDIIIMISKDDNQVHTSLGYRAKEVLVRECTEEIYNETKWQLENGTYYKVLKHMVQQYRAILSGDRSCSVIELGGLPFPTWVLLVICIGPLLLFIMLRYSVIAACGIDLLFCCPKPGTMTPCMAREKRRRAMETAINEDIGSNEDTEPT